MLLLQAAVVVMVGWFVVRKVIMDVCPIERLRSIDLLLTRSG